VRLGRPKRSAQHPASTMAVSTACGGLPSLSGRRSHRPSIHRTQPAPARAELPPESRHPQYVVPHATDFVRVDAHYESPANEAGACELVQVTTQWESARYGTDREISHSGMTQPLGDSFRCGVGCFSALDFRLQRLHAPSHRSSDPHLPRCTPRHAPGPLLIFRKIHLYGKSKKSTHGHQTARPLCPTFLQVVLEIISWVWRFQQWSSHIHSPKVAAARVV
jgi:hypothetical protein